MSRRELPADQRLAAAIREALMIGTTFVVRGSEIEIANAMPVPEALRTSLMADPGALWRWCGGDADEASALAFAAQLGVRHELAETRAQARAAVRRIIADLHRHGPYLAIDVETAPRPEHWRRAPVKFRKDTRPYAKQPKSDPTKAALDPHRSYVALAQLYAGGDTAFLFRGEAASSLR